MVYDWGYQAVLRQFAFSNKFESLSPLYSSVYGQIDWAQVLSQVLPSYSHCMQARYADEHYSVGRTRNRLGLFF